MKELTTRKLLLGSGSRVAQLGLSTIIGFLLTPFIVRSLGAEQYGIWALAYACIGYYSLLDLGMSAAVFTHISYALGRGEKAEVAEIYSTGLAVFGASGGVLALATLVIAGALAHFYPVHAALLAGVVLIVGLITAASFPMRVLYGTLNAGSHFDLTSGISMLGLLLRTAGSIAVLRMHYGVLGLAAVNGLATIPTNLLAFWAVKHTYPYIHVLRARFSRTAGGKLMRFGLPVIFGQLADRVRMQTDTITVSAFLGLVLLAHYNIATTLVMYYMDGILAIIGVLAPVLTMQQSRNDQQGVRQSILAGTRVGVCTAGFVLFAIIAWGHPFLERWMGPAYLDAYPVLVVLASAIFLDVSQATSVSALYATMNQGYYAMLNGAEAAANLVLSLLLVRRFGMMGVAWGTLIPAVIIRIFVQPILVERRLGLSARAYWTMNLRTGARCLLALVVPALITRWLVRPTYPSLFVVGVLSLCAFALPVWRFEFQMRGAQQLRALLAHRLGRRTGPHEPVTLAE